LKIKRSEMAQHKKTCPREIIICANGCSTSIERQQLQQHHNQCPLEEIACTAMDIGCTKRFLRQHIDDHIRVCPILPLQPFLLSLQNENNILKQEVAELKKTIANLLSRNQFHFNETNQQFVLLPIKGSLIEPNTITSNNLSDNAITTNKIANNAITTNKIADNAITTNKIADNAITINNIANNATSTIKSLRLISKNNQSTVDGLNVKWSGQGTVVSYHPLPTSGIIQWKVKIVNNPGASWVCFGILDSSFVSGTGDWGQSYSFCTCCDGYPKGNPRWTGNAKGSAINGDIFTCTVDMSNYNMMIEGPRGVNMKRSIPGGHYVLYFNMSQPHVSLSVQI